jgi:hypothetical protein
MLKDIVSAIDFSDLAQSALLLFVATFGLIIYGAVRLSGSAADRFASIPLSDDVKDPRHGQ